MPSIPSNNISLSLVLFLSHTLSHTVVSLLFFNGQHRGGETLSTKEVKFQSLFQGLPLQLLSKMSVNANAELRSVATKLDSPPRPPTLLDPWRTAGSLRHESMHTSSGAPYCDVPSLELFYLFISSPTRVSPAASSLFWLGLPFPYDRSPAHTQWRKQSQNSTFSSLRPATSSTQPHPLCNYQVSNSREGQMKGAAVLWSLVFSTQI